MKTIRLCLEMLEMRAVPAVVLDASDLDDYSTGVDPSSGNPWNSMFPKDYAGPNGTMSLPEAIREINERGGNLEFQVPFITLTQDLGSIERRVTVTGLEGVNGAPGTVIDGGGAMGGLQLSKGGTVRNLVLNNFSGTALKMFGKGLIENNYIGTDASGQTAIANTGTGLLILASKVTVRNNVLSGNEDDGVQVGGAYSGIKIVGNMIGVGKDGVTAVPNGYGVVLHSGAFKNTIGGTKVEDRNIIAANTIDGVKIQLAHMNKVLGNYIGVNVNGAGNVGNGQDGVHIEGGNSNIIGGVKLAERNIISRNTDTGVCIEGFNSGFGVDPASKNIVRGNWIGLDINENDSGNGIGVLLTNEAQRNTIGGTAKGAGNVISYNEFQGIKITKMRTDGNVIQGNTIGLNEARNAAKPNGIDGVAISLGASGNLIGGPKLSARNVIAGNGQHGVHVFDSGTDDNIIAGNSIGPFDNLNVSNGDNAIQITQASGTIIGGTKRYARNILNATFGDNIVLLNAEQTVIANNYVGLGEDGQTLTGSASGNTNGIVISGGFGNQIGTGTTAGRNVISGNGGVGIDLKDNAGNTLIRGNYIGTDATGLLERGNKFGGIQLESATATRIGGPKRTDGNVISANGMGGIGASFGGVKIVADQTLLQSNLIGTDRTGQDSLGNYGEGVVINGDLNQINTTTTPTAYNVIAYNIVGVRINTGNGNTIAMNQIHHNIGKGIALEGAANNALGPLTINAVTKVGSTLNIAGHVDFAPNSTVRFELYGNKGTDDSGFGEGERFLGFVLAEVDGLGNFVASFKVAIPSGFGYLSLTATRSNDTSEFSNHWLI